MKTFRPLRCIVVATCLTIMPSAVSVAQEAKAKASNVKESSAKETVKVKKKKRSKKAVVNPDSLLVNTDLEPELMQSGMVDLFNGTDLTGWSVKDGQMPFTVSDGEIVGTCDPDVRLNSFLATDADYSDFLFTAEYKWEVLSNSGVMFRAATRALEEGEKRQVKDRSLHLVYGYQCEVESSDRRYTGGIYGEVMGGWKYPLSKEKEHEAARAAVKDLMVWNRVTIQAKGDHIQTWINGVPCANLRNSERDSGFIALQVHNGAKGTIRWRNPRVKDLSAE